MNHDHLHIRRATRADLAMIVRLLADDPLGQQREHVSEPVLTSYEEAFTAIDSDPRQELIVVEAAGEVLATLQLTILHSLTHQGGTRAQIEAVRVDRRYRSQGIGEYLLRWAIERAATHKCHLVQLTTNAQRGDAHRFYERLGFVASHVGMKLDLTNQ